jgi:predicted regulator of Ras-like GTPase activity (Roadblock/LC7/MglB family)
MDSLLPDGTKRIQLGKDQFKDLNQVLRGFYQRTKCQAILLTDASGLMLAKQGPMESKNLALLSTLAAADYAATLEMSKIIGEKDGFKVHFHEGAQFNLYLTGVNETCYIVVVFSKSTTFGMVRVQATKTVEALYEILEREPVGEMHEQPQQTAAEMSKEEFQEELSARLDDILASPATD